jgi:hypothetical protein
MAASRVYQGAAVAIVVVKPPSLDPPDGMRPGDSKRRHPVPACRRQPGPAAASTLRSALGMAEPDSTRDRPGAAASRTEAAGVLTIGTTQLRCGGCHAHALYAQHEPRYGRLVRAFLGQHELCGNAVKITRVRGRQN